MAKKYSKAHYKHWKVKTPGRSDGVRSAVKNLNQAEVLISQAVDFFKQEGRVDQGVIQSLESMAADLRRY